MSAKTSLKNLQEQCKSLGLKTYGTKQTLQQRINGKIAERPTLIPCLPLSDINERETIIQATQIIEELDDTIEDVPLIDNHRLMSR